MEDNKTIAEQLYLLHTTLRDKDDPEATILYKVLPIIDHPRGGVVKVISYYGRPIGGTGYYLIDKVLYDYICLLDECIIPHDTYFNTIMSGWWLHDCQVYILQNHDEIVPTIRKHLLPTCSIIDDVFKITIVDNINQKHYDFQVVIDNVVNYELYGGSMYDMYMNRSLDTLMDTFNNSISTNGDVKELRQFMDGVTTDKYTIETRGKHYRVNYKDLYMLFDPQTHDLDIYGVIPFSDNNLLTTINIDAESGICDIEELI